MRLIADRFTGVTILYSDIVGFTTLAGELEPKEVIKMLSELFTDFDSLATKFHVYKVQTCVLALVLVFAIVACYNPQRCQITWHYDAQRRFVVFLSLGAAMTCEAGYSSYRFFFIV